MSTVIPKSILTTVPGIVHSVAEKSNTQAAEVPLSKKFVHSNRGAQSPRAISGNYSYCILLDGHLSQTVSQQRAFLGCQSHY